MTQKVDIAALAKLARIEVSDEELKNLEREIPDILKFVETIQSVATPGKEPLPEHRNVMRDDANPHEGGMHSKDLLDAAPAQKDNRVVVKQVLSRKKS